MARITQVAGTVAAITAVFIYLYFVVLQRADGYEGAVAAGFFAALLGTLGLAGAIGATIVLWRRAD